MSAGAVNEEAAPAAVVAAWIEYLERVRDAHPLMYPEVEEWAWDQLEARLYEHSRTADSRDR